MKKSYFINFLKIGLTVFFSVLIITTIAKAATVKITPPVGTPVATFFSLSEIYNLITGNTTATAGDPALDFTTALEDTGYTLTEIYNALADLIVPAQVKLGTTYLGQIGILTPIMTDGTATTTAVGADVLFGKTAHLDANWVLDTGTMPNKVGSATVFTPSTADQAITQGYYGGVVGDGKVLGDADLMATNILYGVDMFGVVGTRSSYPNSPSGISGLNQTVCANAGWTWVADSNYDGVNDDPICVQPARDAAGAKAWNNGTANDNTFIGNYSCSDSEGNLETLDAQLNGLVVENAGYGDDGATALALVDCKDGIRNLLSKATVEAFGYVAPDVACDGSGDSCYDGPLSPKVLLEWKGTRLPSSNDFFDVCGNTTISTNTGYYGGQIGRTNNVITTNAGSNEWLSELHYHSRARIAGLNACSNVNIANVSSPYDFRAVFRP